MFQKITGISPICLSILIPSAFLDRSAAVSVHKHFKIVDSFGEFRALVRVRNVHSLFELLNKAYARRMFAFAGNERLMLGENKALRIADQRISGDARRALVRL